MILKQIEQVNIFIIIESKELDIKENINLNDNLLVVNKQLYKQNNNNKKLLNFPIELEIELESSCLKRIEIRKDLKLKLNV